MKRPGWLVSKYIARTVIPYFILGWLLLSIILFVQQGSRYSDIFFSASIPKNLIWQLTVALIPNVVAFTCPMAVLIGVVIGLSRMQTDSELVALRSAGIGNLQISLPVVVLGLFLSVFTLFINIEGVPFAARIVRKVALQTALYKLESPIEAGVFNTEINGYTIYVKDGNLEKGTWKNIFIYYEDAANNKTRLITSEEGRIDSDNDVSELVLSNALVSTISKENGQDKLVSENLRQIRFTVPTRKNEILQKISGSEITPEEAGLGELSKLAAQKNGKEKTEVELLWQRRVILSLNPLLFALLGASLMIRYDRAGQSFGLILALAALLIHYLLTLLGEQLARTGKISVFSAGLIPVVTILTVTGWFFLSKRNPLKSRFKNSVNLRQTIIGRTRYRKFYKSGKGVIFSRLRSKLLDFDIVLSIIKYFLLTFCFLTAIYLIFTAFELWKFAGETDNGFFILVNYLFYLIPFVYIQLAPSALMIAILATFVIKSRQNEIVTWTAAGQSVYRLLLPCFGLVILTGFFNWQFQEKILPRSNRKQDELRDYIRSRGSLKIKTGKYWIAERERIFSFELDEVLGKPSQRVNNLSVYQFSDNHAVLEKIYKSPSAVWETNRILLAENAVETGWNNGKVTTQPAAGISLEQKINPFVIFSQKTNHLTAPEVENLAETSESESFKRIYAVALQKKYTTAFLPFVIALFTLPFSLSLNRKGRIVTVAYAVGVWLLFTGLVNVFEQLGLNNFIAPEFAVWSPIFLFSVIGVFLLTKLKT